MAARRHAGLFFLALTAACSQALPPGKPPDLSVPGAGDLAATEQPDLAPECVPQCPAEHDTRCVGGKQQECVLENGCLRWGSPADCAADQICCGTSCVTSDETNCFGCGISCNGSTPVCSLSLKRCVCTPESCAPSRHDCDPSGICVPCVTAPVPESRSDFYVDTTTTETPTGSMGCPYKTVSDALAPAGTSTASKRTVHIAPGTYATEIFPMVVRSGISLSGAGASTTIIEGQGALDHTTAGGALNINTFATVLLGDDASATDLSGLTIRAPTPAPSTNHYGILCDRGNAPPTITNPPATMPSPNATLTGLTVGPGFHYGVAVTNTTSPAASGCNLKLENSTVSGNINGVWVVGCGTGGPGGIVSAQLSGNQITNNKEPANNGYGTIVWDCSSPVAISGNTYDGNDSGLALAQHPRVDLNIPVPGYITVENNTFKNLTNVGIVMGAAVLVERLMGNTFSNISTPNLGYAGIALLLDGNSVGYRPQIKRARNNSFIGNDNGVVFRGATSIAPDPDGFDSDFGTVGDPGNNIFRCNSTPMGSALVGYDVTVGPGSSGGGFLRFTGNQWDQVPARQVTAASTANGTEVLESGPSPVPVVFADSGTVAAAMCPVGRTP